MVESLLQRYTEWKRNRDNGGTKKPEPPKKRNRKGKGKPERTNKSKNGFKYKLKLDYIPIRGV